ncbi:P2Y purinoceptor 11 [Chlorocebus sabaeus]|uniref:P2Y purinoceptor 11 n=1 Tax=Chlorocebus sabaeus TaxID=60711 RepID=UPI003BF9B305
MGDPGALQSNPESPGQVTPGVPPTWFLPGSWVSPLPRVGLVSLVAAVVMRPLPTVPPRALQADRSRFQQMSLNLKRAVHNEEGNVGGKAPWPALLAGPGTGGGAGAGAGPAKPPVTGRSCGTGWRTQAEARHGSMAANVSDAKSCPANFLAAADHILSGFQEDFLWPILVVQFLVALASNGLALYRFSTREQRPWYPAVVFSVQLAVSDLLCALTLPPLAAYLYPPKHWRYGEAACRLERFLFTCNLLGSVIFITCISLTRYLGIVHPFFTRSHLRPKHAWAVSAAGWVLAALLAMPTLSFSHLKRPQQGVGNCSVARPEACIKCLGTAGHRLEAYRAYSLVLAGLGCGLPLLLTLAAYGALGRAVLRSPSMTVAEKLRVAALVASGVALYASSYVPYHVMRVLNVDARRRWSTHCPSFADVAQATAALELGPYVGYQVMRGLMPLAFCVHPLLYMAAVPSLGCCCRHCPGYKDSWNPEDAKNSGQALPLNATAAPKPSEPQSHEVSP